MRKSAPRRPSESCIPWFVSKETYDQMYTLLPKIYFRRLSTYFHRYGCLRCSKRFVIYGANGLCKPCLGLVSDRLKVCDRVLEKRYADRFQKADRYLHRSKTARALLADLAEHERAPINRPPTSGNATTRHFRKWRCA
jgi:hypothetical protein